MSEKINDYDISIRLNTRHKKQNVKYPVRLRAYKKKDRKVRWYGLEIDLTEAEFEEIYKNPDNINFRGEKKKIRQNILRFETRANAEAEAMSVFDFGRFETVMFRKSSDKKNVKYHFDTAIEKCIKDDKIGTAESFRCALNSLAHFSKVKMKCEVDKLTF